MLNVTADQGGDVGGSSTTPADAVTAHNKAAEMLGDGYSLGTPAVARGGGAWLDVSHDPSARI